MAVGAPQSENEEEALVIQILIETRKSQNAINLIENYNIDDDWIFFFPKNPVFNAVPCLMN